jgi:2-iminobutanoate/2-iminopropanoate deaminase
MQAIIISTPNSPAAIGPYSQGWIANGFIFTSGQLPIHPNTGEVPTTIEEQTIQVLNNLQAIIEAAGSNLSKVVKCTVFIKNFDHFSAMNKVYETYFPLNPPSRSCVEVSKMAKDALVEIEAIALL